MVISVDNAAKWEDHPRPVLSKKTKQKQPERDPILKLTKTKKWAGDMTQV
jgi:hypothetical protein